MSQRIRATADGLRTRPRRLPIRFLLGAAIVAALIWLWHAPQERQRLLQAGQRLATRIATMAEANRPQPPAAPTAAATPELLAQQPTPEPSEQADQHATADAENGLASEPPPLLTQHPIEPLPSAQPLPALDASDSALAPALSAADAGQAWLRNDRFIRRFVATVDNLPNERASTTLWPVHPTSPRFTVEGASNDIHIAAANHLRYAAATQLIARLDVEETVRQYRQYYPLFQQAYEELGYPGRYFNDRLIAVIDHLLQAPEPVAPRVRLMPVRSTVAQQQPWLRYQFEDPRLEALSAGQKILVRIGPNNARTVKAKLQQLRTAIAQPQ